MQLQTVSSFLYHCLQQQIKQIQRLSKSQNSHLIVTQAPSLHDQRHALFLIAIIYYKFKQMLLVDLTVKNATKIPLLGVRNQPSPYIIIECQQISYTSSIAKYSQNPIWNFHTPIEAKKTTSYVHFYIYNNNPNAVDELLAYAKTQFGQLMTRTNTTSKLRLMNSLQQPINSFLFLDHYDYKPADLYLPLGERTSVKLRLIGDLPAEMYFTCQYGDSSFNLSEELIENAFRYSPKYDRIRCVLKHKDASMENELLIGNIGQNNCTTLRFYDTTKDFAVFLATSVVVNGLLPENYNILNAKITDVSKSNGKKTSNYRAKLYGPLNETTFNENAECELYVENSSQVLVEYYQETENIEGYEPYCSFRVPINSLNWSNQTLQATHQLKYYDSLKNIQTVISFKFIIRKSFQLSKIIPKLNNIQTVFDLDSTLLLEQIKLQNCYLFEVVRNNIVLLFHVDMKGVITAFNKFNIGENKTQYTLSTRQAIRDGGRGTLYLVNLDQQFTEKQSKSIQNSLIFKAVINQPNKIEESKIEYGSRFLSFAKKASVVNICKKFNQMVHDDLLRLKVKSRYTGNSRKGILKIVNLKVVGSFGKANALISVDSVGKNVVGQIGNYLMEKSYNFYVSEGNTKIKVKLEGVENSNIANEPAKGKEDYSICYFGSFCDIFGTPTNQKTYIQELKISPTHKLQIVYTYEQGEKLFQLPITKLPDLQFFDAKNSISIRLRRAFVSINNKSYKFRISRGVYSYQSHSYKSNNNKIYFQESQRVTLRMENGQQSNPIFFSAYSYDQEDKLLIYNGFINSSDMMGKGEFQIMLVYEKEEKRKQVNFIIEVVHSSPFLSLQNAGNVKLAKITPNTSLPLFKSLYKHYLLAKINNYQYDIYECTINEQSLTLNASINLRKNDSIIFQLYSSYKAISKELFNSTQKELIGYASVIWEEIQDGGVFILSFYPKKEGQLKFTKNSLIIQEKSYKLYLSYATQKAKIESRIQGLRLKPYYTQIDVLNRGVVNLYVKEFYPLELDSKIVSIQIKSLNLQFFSQSNYKINRSFLQPAENMEFQLQAAITLKQGEKYKRVTSLAHVKLRGNHYKINQPGSIIIYFQQYFYLTAIFTIFHNKFVSIPQGDFTIRQISTRGVKIDRFDVAFSPYTASDNTSIEAILKKEGAQAKNCDLALKTTSEMDSIIFSTQGKGFKSKERICLSQLNIDRYEEEFVYERQILIGGQSLILTLKVSYDCVKQVKQKQMSIKYTLSNQQELSVSYNPDTFNTLASNKVKSQIPNKAQGFFIQILLPLELAGETKQVHIIAEIGQPIILYPSVSKNNEYIYYPNKYLSIKSLKLINRELIDKPVEGLGKQQGLQKFMVDQNPKLICSLGQTACSISSIGNQNWVFRFSFHRLIALNKKRLLSLKNTPNDQILTKQLGVVVKHGTQYRFIRNLDELGTMNEMKDYSFEFGYDNSCNVLEVFLVIDNYFNRVPTQSFQKLNANWIQFFPISYGVLNISNITPDLSFGFQLLPLQNNSYNLEKAINRMMIREENIFCLCEVSFAKKSWGFITIKLAGCTSLIFNNKKEEGIYIYYKVEVQDSNRVAISSFNTEARPIGKGQNIQFTNNSVSFLFIQQSMEDHYNIKITGFVLDNSNHYTFIQKRQDITDCFQRRGKQQLNIQVKANETNNLCKNTFQLKLEMTNTIKPAEKINLIEKAKSINTVDALSFRDMGSLQFLQRLLGCQQLSHFNECLQQIKESFIYVEDPQYSSFIMLVQYLSFNFDSKLIGQICEIIHLNLLKCPQIITDLQESGITKSLYDYFRLICQRERKNVPSKVVKVTSQQYNATLAKFKEKKDLSTLREVLSMQMYLIYTPEQLLASLSSKNNEIVLNIINLLLKHSKIIKESLSRDMEQWIQMFGFTTENSQFQLFILVLKNSILYGSQLTQKNLHRLIEVLLQRTYGLSMVYEFWVHLDDKNQQVQKYEIILQKYDKQTEKNSVETCRGFKMMLSHILSAKNNQHIDRILKAHQSIIKILMSNASKSTDLIVLSSHFDFLTFLFEQKLLNEQVKNEVGVLLKEKIGSLKDNSTKMILSSYSDKFNKGKNSKIVSKSNKKEGLAEEIANKAGFYKKYLITSD